MTREELKEQIDELMQQYASEEIDGDTYAQKMMELTHQYRYVFLIEKEKQVCHFQIFHGNLKKYLPKKAVYMVS